MHPDLRGALDAVSAPRRTALSIATARALPGRGPGHGPERTVPFGDHPCHTVSVEARSSTALLLVIAPLSVSRIQLRQVYRPAVAGRSECAAVPRSLGSESKARRLCVSARINTIFRPFINDDGGATTERGDHITVSYATADDAGAFGRSGRPEVTIAGARTLTLTPTEARTLGAALIRAALAADEVST